MKKTIFAKYIKFLPGLFIKLLHFYHHLQKGILCFA